MSDCNWHWEMQNGVMRKVWHKEQEEPMTLEKKESAIEQVFIKVGRKPKPKMPNGQLDLGEFG